MDYTIAFSLPKLLLDDEQCGQALHLAALRRGGRSADRRPGGEQPRATTKSRRTPWPTTAVRSTPPVPSGTKGGDSWVKGGRTTLIRRVARSSVAWRPCSRWRPSAISSCAACAGKSSICPGTLPAVSPPRAALRPDRPVINGAERDIHARLWYKYQCAPHVVRNMEQLVYEHRDLFLRAYYGHLNRDQLVLVEPTLCVWVRLLYLSGTYRWTCDWLSTDRFRFSVGQQPTVAEVVCVSMVALRWGLWTKTLPFQVSSRTFSIAASDFVAVRVAMNRRRKEQ